MTDSNMPLTLNLQHLDGNYDLLIQLFYHEKHSFVGLAVVCLK